MFIWFLGLIIVLIKGKWASLIVPNQFAPDFTAILIAYLFLYYGPAAAGMFAFGQGLVMDIYSGGLYGLFTLLYLCVYAGIYLGRRLFNFLVPKGQALIVSLSVLLEKLLFIIILTIFSEGIIFSCSFLWISVVSAISSGLIAPVIFSLLSRQKVIPV